jgi:exonuclease III
MNNYTGSHIDYIFGTKSMRMSLKSIGFQYGFAHTEKLETSVNGVELNSGKGVWKYSDHYPILAEFAIYE